MNILKEIFVSTRFIWAMTVLFIWLVPVQDGIAQILAADNFQRHVVENVNPHNVFISVDMNDVPLDEAIRQIGQQAGVTFNYNSKLLSSRENVSYQGNQVSLDKVLESVLSPEIEYIAVRNIIILRKNASYKEEVLQETVTGQVIDADTGEALPGVNILLQGTSTGTATNVEGTFELTVPSLDESLVVSYIGYQTQVVTIDGRSQINVELISEAVLGDELVVVGYGTAQRRHLTGSVGHIDMDEVASRPVVDFGQALYGKMPGVQIQNPSGRPGESSRIQIRGIGSITASSAPLIVVDGVALPSFDLNTLNASDIESIDILKDAASAAIYGSRGANGVILVTTKTGAPGERTISFNYNFTSQHVMGKVDMMNSAEYAQAMIDAAQIGWIRSGGDPNAPNTIEARGERKYTWAPALENPQNLPDVNYQDIVYNTAPMHQANMNVAGGDESSRYYVSFGIVHQDGIIIQTDYEKYTLNLNADTNIGDWLSVGGRINSSYGMQTGSQAIHIRSNASQYPPIYPVYTEDGYLGGPHNQPGFQEYESIYFRAHHGHPLQKIDEQDDRESFNVSGNIFAEIEFLPGLAYRSSFNTFYNRNDRALYEHGDTGIDPDILRRARFQSSMNRTLNYTLENLLLYNNSWLNHHFDLVAGYEFYKREYYSVVAERRDYDNDLLPYLGAGNTIYNADDSANENALVSMFGRINYNFDGRYMASVSFRRDGSSRFGPENKWGNFPAFSAGWRISDEQFMEVARNFLSDLTLRGSYGFTGNDGIGNYRWISSMSQNMAAIGHNLFTSFHPSSVENPNLRWERTRQLNVGLNVGLFDDRILVETDIYRSDSDGLLLDVPIPSTSGFTSQINNIGGIRNSGFELGITSRNLMTNQFFWSTQLTFSHNRGIVTELGPDDAPVIFTSNNMDVINRVGETPFSFYAYDYIGVYRNQEDIDAHGLEYPFEVFPGMGKYSDVNGDGRITADDRTIVGNPEPDFTWAITNSFNFRDFDFSFLIHGNVGGDVYDANWRRSMFYHEGRNYLTAANNRWRSIDEPGDGYIHALTVDVDRTLEREASSYWIHDATFTRLKDVTLGYSLPLNYAYGLGIRSARIYFNMTNVFTLQSTTTIDPENYDGGPTSSIIGSQFSPYPTARTVSIGMNIQF